MTHHTVTQRTVTRSFRRTRGVTLFVTLALVLAACSGGRTLAEPTPDQGFQPTEVAAREATIGQCFNDQNAVQRETRTILLVECRLNHDNQIYAQVQLTTADAAFTTTEELDTQAFGLCEPLFADYVGRAYGESQFEVQTLVPSADSWAEGDRTGGCVVYRSDRSTWTGTAQNSGL